jgi:cytochrome c biogenesis factor
MMLFKVFPKNKEFASQWLGHLSIGLFIIAAIFTEQFDYEKNISFKKDDTSQIFLDSETEVLLKNIQDIDFQNHQKILVSLSVLQNGNEYILSPSKNIYQPSGQVTNEVGTANNLLHQFYATISTIESDQVNLNIVFKPLINLLWISAIMLIFSIFLSVIKRK